MEHQFKKNQQVMVKGTYKQQSLMGHKVEVAESQYGLIATRHIQPHCNVKKVQEALSLVSSLYFPTK